MKKLIFPACFLMTVFVQPTLAKDSSDVALELGTVLASEAFCDLSYDHNAIEAYIQKNVPADDMSFPSMLNMMTSGSEEQFREMSPSAKAAHSAQIRRIAKSFRFVN